ncbi:MAG: DUF2795 domain-containing protein [Dehalococcoidia bacterium]
MQPRATREDFERALAGLEYPVSKAAVVRKAQDHGGIDTEADAILAQLPDRSFDSFPDLVEAIRATYRAQTDVDVASPI